MGYLCQPFMHWDVSFLELDKICTSNLHFCQFFEVIFFIKDERNRLDNAFPQVVELSTDTPQPSTQCNLTYIHEKLIPSTFLILFYRKVDGVISVSAD